MLRYSASAVCSFRAAVACLLLAAGCAPLPPLGLPGAREKAARESAEPPATAAATADTAALRTVLARGTEKDAKGVSHSVWTRAIGATDGGWRWRYADLDALMADNPAARKGLASLLKDSDPVCAANAAIGLARAGGEGNARVVTRLDAAIRTPQFALPMRCAAVEALASLDDATARKTLDGLLTHYGEAMGKPGYLGELHAELLHGQARRVGAKGDGRFRAALKSPVAEVKIEALAALQASGDPLPVEAVDQRTSSEWRVRCAALRALVATGHAEAEPASLAALRDTDLNVRLAAIGCLGQLGGADARAALKGLLVKTESERVRMAAVAALAAVGDRRAALSGAEDASWRVRQETAAALGRLPGEDSEATARKMLSDPSAEVQRTMVAAISAWPLELCGPILLDAMKTNAISVRKAAAEALARKWPPAAEFPSDGPAQRRAEVLASLEARLPAARSQPAAASAAPELTAEDRKRFAESLEMLAAADVQQRRRGADQLAAFAARGSVDDAQLERLAAAAIAESDPLVWQGIFATIAPYGAEPAARLAGAALGHPSADVRRRACEYFAVHPDPGRTGALLPSLADENEAVVCAAAQALGAAGGRGAVEPLRRLLAARSEAVCLAAAAALCRLGEPTGAAALERLSYSPDPHIQRKTAVAMGALGDRAFAATLVRLLDGEPSVQNAALMCLPKVVGRDIAAEGGPPHGTNDRVRRWKKWLDQGGGFDASASK